MDPREQTQSTEQRHAQNRRRRGRLRTTCDDQRLL